MFFLIKCLKWYIFQLIHSWGLPQCRILASCVFHIILVETGDLCMTGPPWSIWIKASRMARMPPVNIACVISESWRRQSSTEVMETEKVLSICLDLYGWHRLCNSYNTGTFKNHISPDLSKGPCHFSKSMKWFCIVIYTTRPTNHAKPQRSSFPFQYESH